MPIGHETIESTLKDLGLTAKRDGEQYLITTKGQRAPVIQSILTPDEDGSGITIFTALSVEIPTEKRPTICELLNLVHGQGLWNVRFHLDTAGRVFSIGKCLLWGKPFNALQFGDIFFSSLVTTDRLYTSLNAIVEENKSPAEAFEDFLSKAE